MSSKSGDSAQVADIIRNLSKYPPAPPAPISPRNIPSLKLAKVDLDQVKRRRKETFQYTRRYPKDVHLYTRLFILRLLNQRDYTSTIWALKLLASFYGLPALYITFGEFQDVAYSNLKDQLYLSYFIFSDAFEKMEAHFAPIPDVSHLAIVMLHEFGHLIYGPEESHADEFVNDFFSSIAKLSYILPEDLSNPTGPGCVNCAKSSVR